MPPSNAKDLNKFIIETTSRKANVHFFRDRDSHNEEAVREAIGLQQGSFKKDRAKTPPPTERKASF